MLIDTHTHLDHEQYDLDREQVIGRALSEGVERIINIGLNRRSIAASLALAERYDAVYCAVGWHPQEANEMTADDLDHLEQQCREHSKVVAIGEIGLDYHWDVTSKEVQQRVFREQIRLARKLNLPIAIHNRDAHFDVLEILRQEKAEDIGGVMHCFSGSWETAQQCLAMNFYISFGGPITFKNAKQPKEVLAQIPSDRLLIETDAPYLAPHPLRGKRNESSYVKYIAEAAAEIRQISFDELAKMTTENAKVCFWR